MGRQVQVKITCDKCDSEPSQGNTPEFWMSVDLRSNQYLYDDGTQSQNYKALICRECKAELLGVLDEFGIKLERA